MSFYIINAFEGVRESQTVFSELVVLHALTSTVVSVLPERNSKQLPALW